MKKKMTAILLVLMLTTVLTVPAFAAAVTDFTDVPANAWYYDAVYYAAGNNLFSGTSATTFSPDVPMSRGMFITVLGRMANVSDSYGRTQTAPFPDVTQSDYFFPYAAWAKDTGIVTGIANGNLNPHDPIPREEMAAFLYRHAGTNGFDLTCSDAKYNSFTDTASVSSFAVSAMQWATAHGIINGSDGRLSPQASATRAQVAQIFLNFSRLEAAAPDEPDTETGDWENYNPTYNIPTGKSASDASGGYYDYDLANAIMEQVNALRVKNGLDALLYHPQIQEWAGIRAVETTIERSHTRPDGSACLTVGVGLDSENLAWISNYTVSEMTTQEYAKKVVEWWFYSESHRLGMLKSSANLGAVSCYIKGNTVYIAHLFSIKTLYFMDYLA